ncbi:TetR/AcrR family transcriptional regulator [Streptomyces aurantiacus]|uniref:Putative Fatty acid metabolism regulator protein n=1 Tax=Streptomyces aurantiacus JA 4570 TaxID=1286094 RepID=S3ZE14_9ACTN|nr:TetR/AcrR family transcriptional regulator [Streptomyces aurantiacus]EPH41388.1 putative Fatty acid metabolism regulator protein [Streptomyces aurantiacus JA 4570]
MPAKARRKRVTKSPDDRRDDILRAGERVFATTGFERATISELADAAEIGKGTFYLYFESKDHLLGALWEQYVDAIVSTAQEILAEGAAWWPTIDRVMSALIGHAVKNAELHRIVYGSANAKALELCRQANQRAIDLMCDYVDQGTQAEAFQALDTRHAFRMAYHAADGLLDDLIAQSDSDLDEAQVTAVVLELMHRALGDHDYVALPQPA